MPSRDKQTLLPLDSARVQALVDGRDGSAYEVLGRFPLADKTTAAKNTSTGVRIFMPEAERVEVTDAQGKSYGSLQDTDGNGLFTGELTSSLKGHYRLRVTWPSGAISESEDPYDFPPSLSDLDLYLINEGTHRHLADALGANVIEIDGISGTRFAVWAPNAQRVAVIGDFNGWDGRRHPMRARASSGVWELFIPGVKAGERYKYAITPAGSSPDGKPSIEKADPVARQAELPPSTASIVTSPLPFDWHDQQWMSEHASKDPLSSAISIYEVHATSWRRNAQGGTLDWHQLADELIPYVQSLGFTHIELLPVAEFPFGDSWGYQPLGLFAPTARLGSPHDFAAFVDRCHCAGIGVLVDWVSAHFPNDAHGLERFDGTPLYEYADPREGFHQDWNTLIYNYGRHEVRGFLIASALEWIERYHIDGLRVDAVASMLYRDYSRAPGEWVPNVDGGRENYEAMVFLRTLNQTIHEAHPGTLMIAEESTSWPGVTAPVAMGGLGFTFKWNMGWMHDTLLYMGRNPIYRRFHHSEITFSFLYAPSENFILPLSHDEVVHGKGSLLNKMVGADSWQKCATLRAYLAFMWGHPGKKLLFMGAELGQWQEWNFNAELDWKLLDDPRHKGIARVIADINRLYCHHPALHHIDRAREGYSLVIGDDSDNDVLAFLRQHDGRFMLIVCNFSPIVRHDYDIGVPKGGQWQEIFNSDSHFYGGTDVGNFGGVATRDIPHHGFDHSLSLCLPPLATLYLEPFG
ncbi:1,4-alpha-glucan branching protein GlgB [Carnimonas nigrificans]|uniref:1,4-alpha-glucan branching protein GlgB n=1 Tax=Carnimonas nigrificans TaxID=64323 RepID=UPI00046E96E9|nr:1,4-alpha-glucan branching protein GlgB [Carnimonas nigrificans]